MEEEKKKKEENKKREEEEKKKKKKEEGGGGRRRGEEKEEKKKGEKEEGRGGNWKVRNCILLLINLWNTFCYTDSLWVREIYQIILHMYAIMWVICHNFTTVLFISNVTMYATVTIHMYLHLFICAWSLVFIFVGRLQCATMQKGGFHKSWHQNVRILVVLWQADRLQGALYSPVNINCVRTRWS